MTISDCRKIPVPHLERLWARALSGRGDAGDQWTADRLVIHGLGLGLHETFQFLYANRPSFSDFEDWVLSCNGGSLSTERLEWLNDALARASSRETAEPPGRESGVLSPLSADDLNFWHQNGYVVLRGAVSGPACAAAAQAICDHLGVSLDAPDSWLADEGCEGIFITLVRHPAFDANRAAPRIRAAFAQLWQTDDLVVTVDRGGFNPPERAGYKFRGRGLHWDTSLSVPIPLSLQGILYLTDTPEEQGAFQCVPGFHRRIEDWLASLPAGAAPREQDLSSQAVRVAGNAGDLVIWHAALPHGATPNRGTRPRLAQYIAYYPPGQADSRPWL